MSDQSEKPILAVLGPLGTYTHQAASDRFGSTVRYEPMGTIEEAMISIGKTASLACVPIENTLHGAVIETLDQLRSAAIGASVHIRDEFAFAINHSLLAVEGASLHGIETVYSHEQALGQCSKFIKENLPAAKLVKTDSTAAASALVAEQRSGTSAAICSRVCADLHPTLKIVDEGIQDDRRNFTRFIVLASPDFAFPIPRPPRGPFYAVLRIIPPVVEGGSQDIMDLLSVAAERWHIYRVDRRPSVSRAQLFHSVYFVAVVSRTDNRITLENWKSTMQDALPRIKYVCEASTFTAPGECEVIGLW